MRIGENETRIVIVIVEGGSEIRCLRPVLSSLYDRMKPNYRVEFPPMVENGAQNRGDFTSKFGIYPDNAAGCINKLYIDEYLKQNGLSSDCIGEIIHIVDMDGAYIEDSNITYDPKENGFYYSDDGRIITSNVESAIKRNEMKRKNIDYLYSLDYIHNHGHSIPYSIYFFSSNLDHVLHGDANMINKFEKVERAENFAMKYMDEPEDFIKAIKDLPGTLDDMTYEESWSFIRERGANSINAHTNINLLLDKIARS